MYTHNYSRGCSEMRSGAEAALGRGGGARGGSDDAPRDPAVMWAVWGTAEMSEGGHGRDGRAGARRGRAARLAAALTGARRWGGWALGAASGWAADGRRTGDAGAPGCAASGSEGRRRAAWTGGAPRGGVGLGREGTPAGRSGGAAAVRGGGENRAGGGGVGRNREEMSPRGRTRAHKCLIPVGLRFGRRELSNPRRPPLWPTGVTLFPSASV